MNRNNFFRRTLVFIVVVLLFCVSVAPCFSVVSLDVEKHEIDPLDDEKSVTCYFFDRKGNGESEMVLSSDDFNRFYSVFEELNHLVAFYPFSDETKVIKVEFVDLLDSFGLIPEGVSKVDVVGLLNPVFNNRGSLFSLPSVSDGRGFAFFCNFATLGEGSQFPVIILPRLIPFLLLPIPRVIMHWNAFDGVTSCGGLLSGKGFIALGAQQGTALGFWGIGFSVFLPPVMSFGFIGYALFASATADEIIPWPPNRPPVVSDESPLDGAVDVPVDLSKLSFRIEDPDGDRMNYSVTTSPSIGSGSGSVVGDGLYTVDVSGLNSNTEYSWHVVVSDGEDFSKETFSFRTAVEAPFVSDLVPVDGDVWVSVGLSELSFRLEDLQGDSMDFTVETVPDIGSGSGVGVGNGVYGVSVGGLDYNSDYVWFVNVTDGVFWTRRFFVFRTQPMMVFDPFLEGWQYRKQVVVNHSLVAGNLTCFPVLVSVVDPDLAAHAQFDGDDILFMDGSGVANRFLHEIEFFDGSSGELVCWVNVSSLSSSVDTVFYLYYGNPVCGSQQYPESVWDSNYLAVFHMNEVAGDMMDATGNENVFNVVNTPTYLQEGKMGYCLDFDGINDYFDNNNMDLTGINEFTLTAWIQPDDVEAGKNENYIFSSRYDYDNDIRLTYHPNGNGNSGYQGIYDDGIVDGIFDYTHTFIADNWYFYASTCDNNKGESKLYKNNELLGIDDEVNFKFDGLDNFHRIGHRTIYNNPKYVDGCLDEIRISKIARSDDWILTEYNTQNNPSSFLSFGLEETPP